MRAYLVPLLFVILSGVSGAAGGLTMEVLRALKHRPRGEGDRSLRSLVQFVMHELKA